MRGISRRSILKSVIALPSLSLGGTVLSGAAPVPPVTGSFNLELQGPFLFLFVPVKQKVLIVAPTPPDHHDPYFASVLAESPIASEDFELLS
jgi:hypothetical protein